MLYYIFNYLRSRMSMMNQRKCHKQEQSSQMNLHDQSREQSECRICLDSSITQTQIMLTPCSCIGSVKYIHQNCLKQWIQKIIEGSRSKPQQGKAHVSCELCGTYIYFSMSKKIKCNNPTQISNSIRASPKFFALFIVVMLISMGFLFALMDFMVNLGWTVLQNYNAFLISLMICAELVFLLITLTMIGFLIKNYLTYQTYKVQSLDKSKLKVNKSLEITKKPIIQQKIHESH